MKASRSVVIAGIFLACASASASSAANAPASGLVDRLDDIRTRHDVPAFAVVLVDRKRLLIAATRGIADLETRRPADESTRFRIGSISKTFTAMAVLRAQRADLLGVSDPVMKWLPDPPYDNPYFPETPVRIVHLLEHTAGLQDWVQDEWDHNDPLPLSDALSYRPASRRLLWPPGRHMSYTNNGAGIVASAIEAATRRTFEDFMSAEVFAPLGMRTATLVPDEETLRLLATGYDTDATTAIPYWHVLFRASAAVSLNPSDMAGPIRMLLNRGHTPSGEFLSTADIERMERVETTLAARSGLTYGYGLGLRQWQTDGHRFFGHGGDGDGYLAHFGYSPDAGMGYFVVINAFRHRPLRRMRNVLEAYIVADLPDPTPAPEVELDEAALEGLMGSFETAIRRFPGDDRRDSISVVREGDRLYTVQGDRRLRLVPVGGGLFRRHDQARASMALIIGPDDRFYLQGPIGSYVRIGGKPSGGEM